MIWTSMDEELDKNFEFRNFNASFLLCTIVAGAKPDVLTQTSEIASKHRESIERGREEIWSYLDIMVTELLTDLRTDRAIP